MKTASVILDIPTQSLDAPYTYAVPDEMLVGSSPVAVGCSVLVPFGGRDAVGFVIALEEAEAAEGEPCDLFGVPQSLGRLKAVRRVLSKPYFDEEGAACALFLSERYVAPLSSCIRLFTPPGGVARMVRGRDGRWRLEEPAVREADDRWVTLGPKAADVQLRKNAVKQKAVLEAVRQGDVRLSELALEFGAVSPAVKALEAKGAVEVVHRRRMRGVNEGPANTPSRTTALARPAVLTKGQRAALDTIERARAVGGGVTVVDGVTGSGKTEVYLRAIESVIAEGKRAMVLVPEISLTPQTVARFRGRFGDAVAVMHSRMGQGERYDQWDFIASGEAKVVVGARSALFTPMADVGLIIIDEEHEGSYKQDSAPRYHARDVAEWMVRRSGGLLVLGSATPAVETLYRCETDPLWSHALLPKRANGRPLPSVEVVDMAAEFRSGRRSMFSKPLAAALEEELSAGRKAVLLLNQRGFAKFLLCRDCGFVPSCPSCETSLTYHEAGSKLVCHHCGYREEVPPRCPSCDSPYLKKFGAGTQRVEAELRALLDAMDSVGPAVPVIRMDADTTARKGAHQELLESFAAAERAVLLGTQMIAKGLDFDDVTLVGVINADTQLHLPDYRAEERTFDLIEQVAGRAGRAELPGRVMIQTYEADNRAVRAAAAYDRKGFLAGELPKRQVLGFPPFVRMANALVWGKDAEAVEAAANKLQRQVAEQAAGGPWEVGEALPCVLGKLRDNYRWHFVVKCPPDQDPAAPLRVPMMGRAPDNGINAAVDVDPVDLL